MTQLDALKTGDFSQIEGYSKENIEETGFTEAQLKDLMTILFGKSTYIKLIRLIRLVIQKQM